MHLLFSSSKNSFFQFVPNDRSEIFLPQECDEDANHRNGRCQHASMVSQQIEGNLVELFNAQGAQILVVDGGNPEDQDNDARHGHVKEGMLLHL